LNRDPFTKEDFTVFEDDVKQEIANLSRDETAVSMCLVIDASGSMIEIPRTVCDSPKDYVEQMRPHSP
jgi:hypothetical protein